jgi:hypothetical protein
LPEFITTLAPRRDSDCILLHVEALFFFDEAHLFGAAAELKAAVACVAKAVADMVGHARGEGAAVRCVDDGKEQRVGRRFRVKMRFSMCVTLIRVK